MIYGWCAGAVGIFYLVQPDRAGDEHIGLCVVLPQETKIIVLCGLRPIAIELNLAGGCEYGCADMADQPCYLGDETVGLIGVEFLKDAVTQEDDGDDRKVGGRSIELQDGYRHWRGVGLPPVYVEIPQIQRANVIILYRALFQGIEREPCAPVVKAHGFGNFVLLTGIQVKGGNK